MNAHMLFQVHRLVHTAVEYVPKVGAFCPVCAFFNLGTFRLIVSTTPGDGLRYARCPNCNFSFKTVEKKVVVKETETLVLKPVAEYSKGRKRKRK